MTEYEVDIYIDGSYIGTKRTLAVDPADAEEKIISALMIEVDVNEVE